jgi:hypothetical protein
VNRVNCGWLFGSPKVSATVGKPKRDYEVSSFMLMRDRCNQKLYLINKSIIIILITVGRIEVN